MGRRIRTGKDPKSYTLPSSPSHSFSSSSSSDFEFTISVSPRKASPTLCPADELFYKGQLLPLHLSPRISMVRTLLLASSSISSSSDTTTTASRDSTGSSNDSNSSFSSDLVLLADCDSSRPSSVTEEDEFKRLNNSHSIHNERSYGHINSGNIKKTKYFSRFSRFSSVFRKESKSRNQDYNVSGPSPSPSPSPSPPSSSVKRMSVTAKEVIRKYLKKVKPLYEKLSQKQQHQQQQKMASSANLSLCMKGDGSINDRDQKNIYMSDQNGKRERNNGAVAHSFSGNLRYPRRRSCVSSCPSSMRSSPSHSGILCRTGFTPPVSKSTAIPHSGDSSSMEELQNAIQGAIAHCKNSMLQE